MQVVTTVNSLEFMANEDNSRVRPVAKVDAPPPLPQQRGVARVPEVGTVTGRLYPSAPDDRPPVFVDDTGRRGRWLAWLSILAALAGLALIGALWISQVSATAL